MIEAYKKYFSHVVSLVGSRNEIEGSTVGDGVAAGAIDGAACSMPVGTASPHFEQNLSVALKTAPHLEQNIVGFSCFPKHLT
jgi:hypothetical protein